MFGPNQVPVEVMFNLEDLQRLQKRPWRRAANAALLFSVLYSIIFYVISRFGYIIPEDMMIAGVITGALISATYGYCVEMLCNRHGQSNRFEIKNNEISRSIRIDEDILSNSDNDETSVPREEPEDGNLKESAKQVLEVDEASRHSTINITNQSPKDLVAQSNTEDDPKISDLPQQPEDSILKESTKEVITVDESSWNPNINIISQSAELVAMSNTENNPRIFNISEDPEDIILKESTKEVIKVDESSLNPNINIISQSAELVAMSNTEKNPRISNIPEDPEDSILKESTKEMITVDESSWNPNINIISQSAGLVALSNTENNPRISNIPEDPEDSILKESTKEVITVDESSWNPNINIISHSAELVALSNTENNPGISNLCQEREENVNEIARHSPQIDTDPQNCNIIPIRELPTNLSALSKTDNNPVNIDPRQVHEENKELKGIKKTDFSQNAYLNPIETNTLQHPETFDTLDSEDSLEIHHRCNKPQEQHTSKEIQRLLDPFILDENTFPFHPAVAALYDHHNPDNYNSREDEYTSQESIEEDLQKVNEFTEYSDINPTEQSPTDLVVLSNTVSKLKISDLSQSSEENTGKAPTEQLLEINDVPQNLNPLKQSVQDLLSIDVEIQSETQEELENQEKMVHEWVKKITSLTSQDSDNLQTRMNVTKGVQDGANQNPSLSFKLVYQEITNQLPESNKPEESSNTLDNVKDGEEALKCAADEEILAADVSTDAEMAGSGLFNFTRAKTACGNDGVYYEMMDDVKLPADLLDHLGYTPKECSENLQ